MASDNMAIDVLDVDTRSAHELEAGLASSYSHLIPMEEERPPSIKQSIKKSVTKSVRKIKYYLSFIFAPFKWALLKFKLLILIVIYSLFGAWLFRVLEVPHDLAAKEEAYHARLIARDVMILNLRAIHLDNREDRELRWKDAVTQFELDVGLEEPSIETVWTFWMSFLYAGTLYTTIGYGNIACQTRGGQVATLIYAFIGIPITLVLLNGLGDFLLKMTKFFANFTSDIILFAGIRWGVTSLEEGSEKRKRYLAFCSKLAKIKIIPAPSHLSLVEESRKEPIHDPPVISAICLTILVMVCASGLFTILEGWDFFTSWYFFFISCSTIGLGDVVPSKPEFMIIALLVMFVGLAMITVCFNVIQEKMEQMYTEMLNKLMEDYLKALENNDPNATTGMMAGFKGKTKFLMPLMSKRTATAAMSNFKETCAEQGIEPPPVLTNIDPDTGMPAFATANKEDFNDFIEQAEEKQAEERRMAEERVQSRLSDVRVTVPVIEVGIQVSMGPVYAPRPEGTAFGTQTMTATDRSFGAQFISPSCDVESQTSESTSVDEGIQTWPTCGEVAVQYDAVNFAYDLPEMTKNTSVGQEAKIFSNTGIQPEVSMFAVSDDSDFEITDVEESDDEKEEEENTIEENLNNLMLPTIQRLRKSVSEESQDTVVSVSPSMSPTSKRKKVDEKKNKKKQKKMKTEGLRFMRHSGDQTSFDVTTVDCQTDYYITMSGIQCQAETSEQSMQYDLKKKGRRCQTRITCIPVEKQNRGWTVPSSTRRTKMGMITQPSIVSITSSQVHSASSLEALAKHPSLHSISEFEVLLSESSELEEVANLEIAIVSKPVDEKGILIDPGSQNDMDELSVADDEITGAEISDEIFDSEDDILEDEMELFVLNECTQTDDLLQFEHIETQASAIDLNILKDIRCQTELSSFRFPPKTSEKRKTEVESTQSVLVKKEDTKLSEERQFVELLDEPQILQSVEEEESRGLMESGVQTTQTMVYVGEQELEEIVTESGVQVQYLVDTGCNPDYTAIHVSCQTEALQTSITISTAPKTIDCEQQTSKAEEFEIAIQAVPETDEQEIQATTECVDGDSQVFIEICETSAQVEEHLWRDEGTASVQIAAECTESATETFIETSEIETQTVIPISHSGYQPLQEFNQRRSVQTTIETSIGETQIMILYEDMNVQTDSSELSEIGIQTDPQKVKRKETSVSTAPTTKTSEAEAVKELSIVGVDATVPMVSTQAQSDVSMFTVDPADRSKLEVEHDVRFNVDTGTWMEEKRQKHIGIQRDPKIHSSSVQVRPSLVTSQTQYVSSCASDQQTQTEIISKNKRSQEVDASQTTQSIAMETEEPTPTGAALWSDFDPIIEEADLDISEASRLSTESVLQSESLKIEEENEEESKYYGAKKIEQKTVETHDAGCSAAPEMVEHGAQAEVETETKASGLEDDEDWVKVYVKELDEERRNRMFDIGIQTGVLARVQHMYGKKDTTVEDSNVDIVKVSMRKTESTETLSKTKKHEGSEESLSHASSVRSIAESVDDNPTTWPSSSRSTKTTELYRTTSMRKPKKSEMKGDVAETIRRFEKRNQPSEKRARSSSSER